MTQTSSYEREEVVHHSKAKDYAQRYSVGTLYHEGRERLLLSGLPMVGAYSSATSSSFNSSTLLSSSSHNSSASASASINLPYKGGLSSLNSSPINGRQKLIKRPADADVSESDSAPSWDEAVAAAAAGNERVMGLTQSESMDLFSTEVMDDSVPEHEHESAPSSSSVRAKGAQERERVDREFRSKWSRILDVATAVLVKATCAVSKGPGPGPIRDGHISTGPDLNGHHSYSVSAPKGKTKKAKDKDNASQLSSTNSTVAAAQALLDEACALQPYVDQPGEGLADIIRSTLGELMMVGV